MNDKKYIPWVEKYRPNNINDIILDPINSTLINNIIKQKIFPNLLFYGPPGSGKTTTIINLIKENQLYNNNCFNSKLIIHLNASDDRGIDIIRNQLFTFVNSNNFFNKGIKYIILDEVDYMTKTAQQSLKYLIQSSSNNVVYCLICNYISKIDESLRNEFIRFKFNQLPTNYIISFLDKINKEENLNLSQDVLFNIQYNYNSDIRSMINYLQSNQYNIGFVNIIKVDKWDEITNLFLNSSINIIKYNFINYSFLYNINIKSILKKYVNYLIKYKTNYINESFLDLVELIFHSQDTNVDYLLCYFIYNFKKNIQQIN